MKGLASESMHSWGSTLSAAFARAWFLAAAAAAAAATDDDADADSMLTLRLVMERVSKPPMGMNRS